MIDGLREGTPQPPPSADVILKGRASSFRAYLTEAHQLLDIKDAEGYTLKMMEAGRVIAGLNDIIMQDGVDKTALSEKQLAKLRDYSALALEYVEEGNVFGIGTLFIPRGSKIGEPDDLEKLIEEVYPTSSKTDEK